MFIDIFLQLCNNHGVKPTRVANEIGSSSASVVKWKKGAMPQGATLQKLANYFDVSVDYLLGKEKSPAEAEDNEINDMLEELKNNPGKRLLFSKTKKATKEDIEKIIAMVDIITGGNDNGGNYY